MTTIEIELRGYRSSPELRSETMTVNMGPQHPSTHGVLRIVLELSGETVVSADTTIGFLHTGIEKTAEQKKWQQVIPLVERMDYLGAQSNSLAFCLSVEKLLGVEVARARPRHPRAHRGAAAHHQPSRLARHARSGDRRDLGDDVLLPRAGAAAQHQRDARRVPDVPELPPHRRAARGSAARVSTRRSRRSWTRFPQAQRIRRPADAEPDLAEADAGVGIISKEDRDRVRPGRADGARRRLPYDVRRTFPYLGYETYDFDVPVGTDGDVYDRYLVRMEEMRQSTQICRQALSRITPRGVYDIQDYRSSRRRRTRSTPRWKRSFSTS